MRLVVGGSIFRFKSVCEPGAWRWKQSVQDKCELSPKSVRHLKQPFYDTQQHTHALGTSISFAHLKLGQSMHRLTSCHAS